MPGRFPVETRRMLTFQQTPEDTRGVLSGTLARSMPIPAKKVSAVIITFNESRNIRRTLSKLSWCDEIVIVDSYSTDDTLEICREFGCKIFFRSFDGYGAQKRFAVSRAKNDWILCIDADEVPSESLCREIQDTMAKNPSCTGYQLPMNLVFLGREFLHGKESQRYFLRLFNRQAGDFNMALVHEKLELKGETGRLQGKMLHYSYANLRQWNEKYDRYSSLSAREAVGKGKKKSILAVLSALPYYFLRYYFLERNFLNGLEGFYWSVFNAQYHFLKYVKIRELRATAPTAPTPFTPPNQ